MFLVLLWGLAVACLALQITMPILWTDRWRVLALLPLVLLFPAILGLGLMTGLSLSGTRPGEQSVIFTLPLFFFVLLALPGCLIYYWVLILGKPGWQKNRLLTEWDDALSGLENMAVLDFFEQEILNDQECNLQKRYLRYWVGSNKQWFLLARPQHVLVIQQSRFEGDLDFWRIGLSRPGEIKQVKNGSCLRFLLITKKDLQFFRLAWDEKLTGANWVKSDLRPAPHA